MNKTTTNPKTLAANEAILAALRKAHSIASPASTDPEDLKRQRLGQEALGRLLTPPIGFSWEPFEIDGIPAAWVRPEGGHDRSKIILYCHGGGYTSGTLGYARLIASRMALATGYEVLAFQYRLAPEHPYPEALEDARLVWEYLMYLGWGARDIILAGDSAGGNLALELALDLRDSQRMLPWRMVLLSPWTDMTASGDSYEECRDLDPLLIYTVIRTESGFDPMAESEVGARGLMQITEVTFDWIKSHYGVINAISGGLLVFIGIFNALINLLLAPRSRVPKGAGIHEKTEETT